MRWILIPLFLTGAIPAFAIDGVSEINQTCAVQTGCFAGDTAGVPVTITTPGSYRLTSDLLAPTGVSGIRIEVNDVTLDLNGFTVSSAGGFALMTHGITGASLTNIEVRNGTVRNFPTSGVHLPSGLNHRVLDVRVFGNGNFGINIQGAGPLYGGHLVRGCTAMGNGTGVRVEPAGSLVVDSVARNNTFVGFELGASTGYARNAVSGNQTDVNGGVALDCNLVGATATCPPP